LAQSVLLVALQRRPFLLYTLEQTQGGFHDHRLPHAGWIQTSITAGCEAPSIACITTSVHRHLSAVQLHVVAFLPVPWSIDYEC
jgi:hypothetical protein